MRSPSADQHCQMRAFLLHALSDFAALGCEIECPAYTCCSYDCYTDHVRSLLKPQSQFGLSPRILSPDFATEITHTGVEWAEGFKSVTYGLILGENLC
jgi:hypothetical protein